MMRAPARPRVSSFHVRPTANTSRSRTVSPQKEVVPTTQRTKLPLFASAFLVCVFIPWLWTVGSLVLTPYRVVLLVGFVPCMYLWLSGKAGKVSAADILIILYCLWSALSLCMVHGAQTAVQSGGVIILETAGAYFFGRCFIRGPDQFYGMVRLFLVIVAIMFPFTLFETLSNQNITLELFSKLFAVPPEAFKEARWGLRRVQGVFEHPILFGVSCGAMLSLVHMVYGFEQTTARRWFASTLVFTTAFLSLSSGPITALIAQTSLIFWNWFLAKDPRRWQYLWIFSLSIYAFIALASNQSVFQFLLSRFSFEPVSAYYRVLIWEFGTHSVVNHPLFGVGYGRWDRPEWMPPSIDMFWLYHAILFGLPAAIFMMGGFLTMFMKIAFKKESDTLRLRYRIAYLIMMTGYFLVGWTVHFWNATYVLFLFLLGSGSWLLDGRDSETRSKLRGLEPSLRIQARKTMARTF
ncbi:O-antigen ligase family protein [Pararhizobium sp. PWRC1-1]|uniref:O-antigen ligase family protein n=1 Tax=Pararhizobium sp. PWRC1-1 TaxID=2804566 RepID=UPI003CF95348